MKTKNKLLLLTGFLLLLQSLSFGQGVSKKWLFKESINNAEFVFEGTVVESNPFQYPNNTSVYTAYLVEINHLLKGDISSDKVNFIVEGGMVGNKVVQVIHGIRVGTGGKYIFFAKEDNLQGFPDSLKLPDSEPLVPSAYPMNIRKDSIFTGFDLKFTSSKSFFDTLRTFGLDVPEKAYLTKRIDYSALRKHRAPVDSVALKKEEEKSKANWERILKREALIQKRIEEEKKKDKRKHQNNKD